MSRVLRCLLVWCLVLALPVQGLAAAAMRSCHAAAPINVASEAEGHHHHAAAPAGDEAAADSSSRCSACALCCLGAAWIPLPLATPQLPASWHAAALAPLALYSFVPAGLERPPRSLRLS